MTVFWNRVCTDAGAYVIGFSAPVVADQRRCSTPRTARLTAFAWSRSAIGGADVSEWSADDIARPVRATPPAG
jgi:hypothetical protein